MHGQTISPPVKQSIIGIISLVSSIAGLVMIIGVIPLMSYLDRAKTELSETVQSLGALYIPAALLLALFSIMSGIAGLFSRNHRKDFAMGGLLIGIISILLLIILVVALLHPHASSRS